MGIDSLSTSQAETDPILLLDIAVVEGEFYGENGFLVSWGVDFEGSDQLPGIDGVGICHVILVSGGINKVVKVTDVIKLGCLNLCDSVVSAETISRKFDSVALSHGVIDCAENIVLRLELYVKVKVLHLNFGTLNIASLKPCKNNGELSILEMAHQRNIHICDLSRKGQKLSCGVLEILISRLNGHLIFSDLWNGFAIFCWDFDDVFLAIELIVIDASSVSKFKNVIIIIVINSIVQDISKSELVWTLWSIVDFFVENVGSKVDEFDLSIKIRIIFDLKIEINWEVVFVFGFNTNSIELVLVHFR